jgi:hypothetical protein
LYIVDVDQDKSKQITFQNLFGTKVGTLSTDFLTLSGNLMIDIDANADNITAAQGDIVVNTIDIVTLSANSATLSADVANLSATVFTKDTQISGVDLSNFSFGTAMTVSSGATITQHISTNNTEIGDIGMVSLSALGGLSGIETNFYPLSTNVFELLLTTRVNDDRSITIPANTVFTYFVTRNIFI